ncbi:hypothetical protein ACJIZ3_016823 [Penstemon smallii]|uniref:Uncharacterized protein n=1 Tax=Penstemon smallii TaxID=265156 RepID=A0ABD3STT1_9LAMI
MGTITSVHCESSRDTSPMAFISSTKVFVCRSVFMVVLALRTRVMTIEISLNIILNVHCYHQGTSDIVEGNEAWSEIIHSYD